MYNLIYTRVCKFLKAKLAFDKNLRHEAQRFLSNRFSDKGNNNKFIIVQNGNEQHLSDISELYNIAAISESEINIIGSNNIFRIFLPTTLQKLRLNCSSDNVTIEIGKNCVIRDSDVIIWGGEKAAAPSLKSEMSVLYGKILSCLSAVRHLFIWAMIV